MNVIQLLKKSAIFIVGIAVVIIGIILLPLPGPGFLIIALGLFILSTEFSWAEKYLKMAKDRSKQMIDKAKGAASKDKNKF